MKTNQTPVKDYKYKYMKYKYKIDRLLNEINTDCESIYSDTSDDESIDEAISHTIFIIEN